MPLCWLWRMICWCDIITRLTSCVRHSACSGAGQVDDAVTNRRGLHLPTVNTCHLSMLTTGWNSSLSRQGTRPPSSTIHFILLHFSLLLHLTKATSSVKKSNFINLCGFRGDWTTLPHSHGTKLLLGHNHLLHCFAVDESVRVSTPPRGSDRVRSSG